MNIEMLDKSILKVTNKNEIKAVNIRIKENKDWLELFKKDISDHWDKKTIPTKFDIDEKWSKQYKNHAEFAKNALYVYIRVIIMSLVAKELGGLKIARIDSEGNLKDF